MQHEQLLELLTRIGASIGDRIQKTLQEQGQERLSGVYRQSAADTIYTIDREVEEWLLPALREAAPALGGLVLIAEGIGEEGQSLVLPEGMPEAEAALRLIVDPVDGSRGLMYDKRSAFFLAAAAPNRGAGTRLSDLELAVMVELPGSKGRYSDTLRAVRGRGLEAFRRDLISGEIQPLALRPSAARSIQGGFAQLARFFPQGKTWLAALEEDLLRRLFPDMPEGEALAFEDQYISSSGQLYELLAGHDRFTADLRATAFTLLKQQGQTAGLTAHPYDLCAHLIGTEAGLIITGADGSPLDAPLDTTTPVDWIAYANEAIRREVEPVLQQLLHERRQQPRPGEAASAAAGTAEAEASGRLDLMGGIADYSGALLLQWPLPGRVKVRLELRDDGVIELQDTRFSNLSSTFFLSEFYDAEAGKLLPYPLVIEKIRQSGADTAVRLVLGCFYEAMRRYDLRLRGARVKIEGELPEGHGLGFTAALEVAALRAMRQLFSLPLSDEELPLAAQQIETRIMGHPAHLGALISAFSGESDQLLPIRCQPALLLDPLELPGDLWVAGIEAGPAPERWQQRYAQVRTAAFMSYTLIALAEGADAADIVQARQSGDWSALPFGGYLANIDAGDFHEHYAPLLPEAMSGADFLAQYPGVLLDPYSEIDPAVIYPVQRAGRHPVEENRRAQAFHDQLVRWEKISQKESVLQQLGAYMLASHRSYVALGLSSAQADELVEELQQRGPTDGIYGARLSGARGRMVSVLGYLEEGREAVVEVAEEMGGRRVYFGG